MRVHIARGEAESAPQTKETQKMVAKQAFDRGISTAEHSQFNYDGVHRDFITLDEARNILNFSIEKKPCFTEDGLEIPRMNYLRRSDGGIVDSNCSVGGEFEVTSQPSETLELAQYIMQQAPAVRIETVATMYNGGTTFVTLSYGDKWMVKGDSSPHWTNIVLSNPLTRGKIHLVQSVTRVVCENTLAMACKNGEGYRIAHTTNARAMMAQALEGMRVELAQAEMTRKACEWLGSRSIGSDSVSRLLDVIYPLPEVKPNASTTGLTRMKIKRDEVMHQFETDSSFGDKTFYSFLSANTYLSEHPLHKQERTDSAQVAFENITGSRAEWKRKVLKAVLLEAASVGGGNAPKFLGDDGEVIEAQFAMIA